MADDVLFERVCPITPSPVSFHSQSLWGCPMPTAVTFRKWMDTGYSLGAALLLWIGLQANSLATPPVSGPLVGTWRLISYTDTVEGEAPIHAFGVEPIGVFIFTADGYFAISIMRNPPDVAAPTADPDPDACIPGWFCAYFGTYDVDYKTSTWVTHVRGANAPGYLGTDQSRHFSIHGDRLVISESYEANGKTVHVDRILVRETRR